MKKDSLETLSVAQLVRIELSVNGAEECLYHEPTCLPCCEQFVFRPFDISFGIAAFPFAPKPVRWLFPLKYLKDLTKIFIVSVLN